VAENNTLDIGHTQFIYYSRRIFLLSIHIYDGGNETMGLIDELNEDEDDKHDANGSEGSRTENDGRGALYDDPHAY